MPETVQACAEQGGGRTFKQGVGGQDVGGG